MLMTVHRRTVHQALILSFSYFKKTPKEFLDGFITRTYLNSHLIMESWSNAKMNKEVKVKLERDAKSVSTDPYSCTIKAKHSYFIEWKTVGDIPCEISLSLSLSFSLSLLSLSLFLSLFSFSSPLEVK